MLSSFRPVSSTHLDVYKRQILSTVIGFIAGFVIVRTLESICKNMDRRKTNRFFKKAQVAGGAAMAFMHGAQEDVYKRQSCGSMVKISPL